MLSFAALAADLHWSVKESGELVVLFISGGLDKNVDGVRVCRERGGGGEG